MQFLLIILQLLSTYFLNVQTAVMFYYGPIKDHDVREPNITSVLASSCDLTYIRSQLLVIHPLTIFIRHLSQNFLVD